MRRPLTALAVAAALWAGPARGEDAPDPDQMHPAYSADDRWARPVLIGVGTLFALAATVGPIVWWKSRGLVPLATTHEEDPAADRHP